MYFAAGLYLQVCTCESVCMCADPLSPTDDRHSTNHLTRSQEPAAALVTKGQPGSG